MRVSETPGMHGDGPGVSSSPFGTALHAHMSLGALKPGVRLFQATPNLGGSGAVGPVWAPGWCTPCGIAVSAEDLKPIIKSTVSQSAFYYPHAGNSKQCQ